MTKRDHRSHEAEAWRPLYKTAAWRKIRADQLARFPLCAMCLEQDAVTPATVCNHTDKAAKATPQGFFAGPFNSLCKTHHDSTQQRQERRGYVIGCNESGLPLDPRHAWNR